MTDQERAKQALLRLIIKAVRQAERESVAIFMPTVYHSNEKVTEQS